MFKPSISIKTRRLNWVDGGSWEGVKSIPRSTAYHRTVGYIETIKSPFMTSRVRGVYYYPDPPRVPFY